MEKEPQFLAGQMNELVKKHASLEKTEILNPDVNELLRKLGIELPFKSWQKFYGEPTDLLDSNGDVIKHSPAALTKTYTSWETGTEWKRGSSSMEIVTYYENGVFRKRKETNESTNAFNNQAKPKISESTHNAGPDIDYYLEHLKNRSNHYTDVLYLPVISNPSMEEIGLEKEIDELNHKISYESSTADPRSNGVAGILEDIRLSNIEDYGIQEKVKELIALRDKIDELTFQKRLILIGRLLADWGVKQNNITEIIKTKRHDYKNTKERQLWIRSLDPQNDEKYKNMTNDEKKDVFVEKFNQDAKYFINIEDFFIPDKCKLFGWEGKGTSFGGYITFTNIHFQGATIEYEKYKGIKKVYFPEDEK